MFTLAIVAGLLGWGLPTFRDLHRNAARTREVNQFIQAVYLARSEAIKRNGVVSLCPSTDGEQCCPAGTPWHRGWIVFVNGDRDAPAERDPGEDLLQVFAPWDLRLGDRQPRHPVLPAVRPDGRDRHASRSATSAARRPRGP